MPKSQTFAIPANTPGEAVVKAIEVATAKVQRTEGSAEETPDAFADRVGRLANTILGHIYHPEYMHKKD